LRAPRAAPSRSADLRLLGREVDPAARPRPEHLLHQIKPRQGATRDDRCHVGSRYAVSRISRNKQSQHPRFLPHLPTSPTRRLASSLARRAPGPSDPAWGHRLHCVCRDSTFSRPSTKSASPSLQAREGTRWGVNGDSDSSGSARQQQTSWRSTGSPRAGSEGEGSLATRRSARADERRPAATPARDRPRREPDERADGPEPGHLMARSARRRREAGRALGRRAIGTGPPGECRG
jgi:hypothetical protein